MNEEWKRTLDSITDQFHQLNVRTNKDFKIWINQHPQQAQRLIRTLLNMLVYLMEPIEED